jgi:hypothetical protein
MEHGIAEQGVEIQGRLPLSVSEKGYVLKIEV